MRTLPAGIAVNVGVAALLAGALLVIFLLGRRDAPPPSPPPGLQDTASAAETIAGLDAGIDSVLSGFGITAGAVRKRTIEIPGEGFARTERLVSIPDTLVPVSINAALNIMAKRLGARAIASENLRLRTVTIHLELGGAVVHTVILRMLPPDSSPDGRRPRVST